ncbi:MAG: adenylate/guanylate cyclase domain-containing protein [Aquabacterium sp.]|nr:adenylate/guanylate cyclase domain-containing protein [Aquabacterium sp.]
MHAPAPLSLPLGDAQAEVVFLFADIEGSTRLWEQQPAAMAAALARHDQLARSAVADCRGQWVKGTGDGLHAAFIDAADALAAALQLQRALADLAASGGLRLALRCGLHAGPAQARDNDWFGPEVNRAARIMSAAHGGQMLVSHAVAGQLQPLLPPGVQLRDLGAVRLKDLDRPERVWQVLAPPLRTDFPPLRSLEATPNNLAQQLNRFIGRESVLPELRSLLGRERLVTLLGTGGIGKSRLAVQLAADLVDAYPDGVWLVELAPLDDDAARLPQAVASVLGVKEEPGRPLADALRQHVASRRLLLVLDNCEHVLDAAAALAKGLLQAGAGLSLLATSRAPLQVAGEQVYPVPALGLPDLQRGAAAATPDRLLRHEAVRLFVDRARSADPGFALTPDNAAAVVDICRRLDGIALALELAAARVRVLPVQVMAERLRDSFALLSTRDTTVAPRQRTLQRLIDWSHDLLADDERVLYRRLSVFAGGWTLEAAEAVCADDLLPADAVLDALAALADQSLVGLLPGADGSPRYRMLDTVRQHADALLQAAGDEAAATRRRHAHAQLALAESAQQRLAGAGKAEALALLDLERDNLLAALAWCAQDQAVPDACAAAELGLRLSFALRPYWLNRGLLSLGLDTTVALLAHPGAQARDGLRARGLFNAGQLEAFMGRYAQASPQLLECLAIARETGDAAREAAVLQPLCLAAGGMGDLVAARRHAEQAVAAARVLDNPRQLAGALSGLGQLDRLEGRLAQAQDTCTKFLALASRLQDPEYIAAALLNLAMVALAGGRLAEARRLLLQVVEIVDDIGSRPAALCVIDVCAALAALLADYPRAARWYGLAQTHYQQSSLHRDAADAAFVTDAMAAVRAALGAGFDELASEGRADALEPAWGALVQWLSRSSPSDPAA